MPETGLGELLAAAARNDQAAWQEVVARFTGWLGRAPGRLVLSRCDSERVAAAGADDMLGLASALMPLGTAAIVAGVVPVDDAAAGPLMDALHHLPEGAGMAEALRRARVATATGDPGTRGIGWSFVTLGAG